MTSESALLRSFYSQTLEVARISSGEAASSHPNLFIYCISQPSQQHSGISASLFHHLPHLMQTWSGWHKKEIRDLLHIPEVDSSLGFNCCIYH